MNERQSIDRTRPWPLETVFVSLARTMRRSATKLSWPQDVRPVKVENARPDLATVAECPTLTLDLQTGRVASIAAWAAALDVIRVTVYPEAYQAVISVVGKTSLGPVVAVLDTVSDWPLEAEGSREITAEELAAVAESVRTADVLAGAR